MFGIKKFCHDCRARRVSTRRDRFWPWLLGPPQRSAGLAGGRDRSGDGRVLPGGGVVSAGGGHVSAGQPAQGPGGPAAAVGGGQAERRQPGRRAQPGGRARPRRSDCRSGRPSGCHNDMNVGSLSPWQQQPHVHAVFRGQRPLPRADAAPAPHGGAAARTPPIPAAAPACARAGVTWPSRPVNPTGTTVRPGMPLRLGQPHDPAGFDVNRLRCVSWKPGSGRAPGWPRPARGRRRRCWSACAAPRPARPGR